jgi:molybdate transport system regulatory protein
MSNFRVRSKVWLEFNGQPFFGEGRYRLLSAVSQTGSINAAAKALKISYRKAWSRLEAMEKNAPFALLDRQTGGKGGGATRLTAEAENLLSKFEDLRDQVNQMANRSFADIFDQQQVNSCASISLHKEQQDDV